MGPGWLLEKGEGKMQGWETLELVAKGVSGPIPQSEADWSFFERSALSPVPWKAAVSTASPAGSLEPGWGPGGNLLAPLLPSASLELASATSRVGRTDMAETPVSPPCLQPGCFCSPKQASPKLPLCFHCVPVLLL